jgi:hypothetical protein
MDLMIVDPPFAFGLYCIKTFDLLLPAGRGHGLDTDCVIGKQRRQRFSVLSLPAQVHEPSADLHRAHVDFLLNFRSEAGHGLRSKRGATLESQQKLISAHAAFRVQS